MSYICLIKNKETMTQCNSNTDFKVGQQYESFNGEVFTILKIESDPMKKPLVVEFSREQRLWFNTYTKAFLHYNQAYTK